ncbi:DUF262 domain-containing protein [Luteolibacter luteus]|uniref:DUF262 domain-containing protein n=1 Tax=Luteolibacter luteus TaxID=2728835 RepID=A0A858RDU2_9BACT|nr:DUF262 domain-containing protein [Luteolibacter luteus]QJE94343.1 DUF262 domain-containing protein [Luteolibacter luteus]
MPPTDLSKPHVISLKQIAAWDLEDLNAPFQIKASVPALQRGLVWSPQQVELLWDSILRGFPIGCLVVTSKLEEQERGTKTGITHHLLDGQQRCNAITLGYHDPFDGSGTKVRGNASESILWLDLAPDGIPNSEAESRQIPNSSTREFLTRVTTLAHPWGYQPDDSAGRLAASEARDAVEWEYYGKEAPKHRPLSRDLLPWRSNAPVPLSWLTRFLTDDSGEPTPKLEFWNQVKERLEQEAKIRRWPTLALEALARGTNSPSLETIHAALLRVERTRVVIIEAPPDLLAQSQQERAVADEGRAEISSIEHLFSRLNRLGKPLDGEELAYSLIKAYWPEVANLIDAVATRRLPASHLVSLAIRTALTDPGSTKLARGITIPRLRAIAKALPPSEGEEPSVSYQQRMKIESFIGNGTSGFNRLANACAQVDEWLTYDPENALTGLPPVLVASFARSSSDIFLFLLHLADRLRENECGKNPAWKELLPGLATIYHWFSKPGEQAAIADLLLESISGEISPESVRRGMALTIAGNRVILPQAPEKVQEFILIPDDEQLPHWKWWSSLIESFPQEDKTTRETDWKPFLQRTVWSKELLLYAQRDYLHRRFPSYDPSRRDLWENHNRPWDFDHLHASAYFYNAKSGAYADFCRQWGNCIGNLRAWPFEDNRSDEKRTAKEKLGGRPQQMRDSLIWSETEIDAFSHGDNARLNEHAARSLAIAIRQRYLAIYQDWYESVGIKSIVLPELLAWHSPA